jgi:lipoprotein-releasing system ATP-binding protein
MSEFSSPILPSKPLIRCRGLTKNFKSEAEVLQVLKHVDLDINAGCSCSIIGASGSGKSTLLAILGGLETFDSGDLEIGPYALKYLKEKDLPSYRSKFVGFVFQFHYLLKDFTALENVALPAFMAGIPKKQAWEKAFSLLEKVGLKERVGHYPSELSGGERQRAAIARAIINQPSLVLADEPTGNLDSVHAMEIQELLFQLPKEFGTTIVLATHDQSLASSADMQLALIEGKIKAI